MQRVNKPEIINRAGLIPYYITPEDDIKMMFMIPVKNNWVESIAQVSKGRIEDDETPLKAAIREAVEELGLKKSNLRRIDSIGQFSSIMMFVGEIIDPNDFDLPDPQETASVVWYTYTEFLDHGRKLHNPVVFDAISVIEDLIRKEQYQDEESYE